MIRRSAAIWSTVNLSANQNSETRIIQLFIIEGQNRIDCWL